MKVAMFTDTFLPNTDGVVTSICNQIKGLSRQGIEVIVFTPGEKTKVENFLGARIYYIKGFDLKQYPGYKIVLPDKVMTKILTLIEIENPDIYHTHSPFSIGAAGLLFAGRFNKPSIATFHTNLESYICYLGKDGYANRAFHEILKHTSWQYFRMFFNGANFTITPTKEISEILTKKKFKRINVIPTSIDFDFLKKQKRVDIRKKLGLSKSTKIIMYVGRLGFEKKICVLLDAFKKSGVNATLVIVGKGPAEKHYKDYTKEHKIKRVIFTGYVPDTELPSYYRSCDLFVSPSDSETQGLTFIEAMYFEKPVIGANALGVKEVIKNYKNGLKFKPNDAEDLKKKIVQILENKKLYSKIKKNAKKSTKRYNIEKLTKKLISLYKKEKHSRINVLQFMRTLNKRFKNTLKLRLV